MEPSSSEVFLVEGNVLIDAMSAVVPAWTDWSVQALSDCSQRGILAINPIVFAELSSAYARLEDLDRAPGID